MCLLPPKKLQADGTYDGGDVTVSELFDEVLQERAGYPLKKCVVCVVSDRAATGAACQIGLDDSGYLMHDIDELPRSNVGAFVRADMTKPVVNGHPLPPLLTRFQLA